MKKGEVKKGEVKKREMKKGEMKKGEMKKGEMKKEDKKRRKEKKRGRSRKQKLTGIAIDYRRACPLTHPSACAASHSPLQRPHSCANTTCSGTSSAPCP